MNSEPRGIGIMRGAYGLEIPSTIAVLNESVRILRATSSLACRPMHYRALAAKAIESLGYTAPNGEIFRQVSEHVRQPADEGRHGLCYLGEREVGRGHGNVGLIFLREWVEFEQQRLFHNGEIETGDIDFETSVEASTSVALRLPHMYNTFGDSDAVRAKRASEGLIAEAHVSRFFRQSWPSLWRAASNQRRYDRPSSDDFRLRLKKKTLAVDVKRRNRDGGWAHLGNGNRADIYLLSDARGTEWVLVGWCTKKMMADRIDEHNALPLRNLYLRLNCEIDGVDYDVMRSVASRFPLRSSHR